MKNFREGAIFTTIFVVGSLSLFLADIDTRERCYGTFFFAWEKERENRLVQVDNFMQEERVKDNGVYLGRDGLFCFVFGKSVTMSDYISY